MKLRNGEVLVIPEVIRTACHSTLVNLYCVYCREIDYVPLGRTSLYHVLSICPASRRTNLRGLDNIATDGSSAIDTLIVILNRLKEHYLDCGKQEELKECEHNLSATKIYLKTDFKLHLQVDDPCPNHCLSFALSDSTDASFQKSCTTDHSLRCDRCSLFPKTMNIMKEFIQILPGLV